MSLWDKTRRQAGDETSSQASCNKPEQGQPIYGSDSRYPEQILTGQSSHYKDNPHGYAGNTREVEQQIKGRAVLNTQFPKEAYAEVTPRDRRGHERMSNIMRMVDTRIGPIPTADPELTKMLIQYTHRTRTPQRVLSNYDGPSIKPLRTTRETSARQ